MVTYAMDKQRIEEASKKFGWNFDLTIVQLDKLVEDFKTRSNVIVVKRHNLKTHLRIYVCPKIKEKYVAMGMGVDIWYGSSKKVAITKSSKSKFDAWRKGYTLG